MTSRGSSKVHRDRDLRARACYGFEETRGRMSLFDLSGKVAVVTGSSRGIGRAIVERFAEHGAKVVVSSRKPAACQEVVDRINQRHGETRAIAIPANISSKEDLRRLIEETQRALGEIDILVCNAASNPY